MKLPTWPSNPTGVVATGQVCKEVAELANRHGILLVSDEIYDEFCYEKTDDPTSFKARVLGDLPAGTYRITWRTAGEDGHAIRGRYDFEVGTTQPKGSNHE